MSPEKRQSVERRDDLSSPRPRRTRPGALPILEALLGLRSAEELRVDSKEGFAPGGSEGDAIRMLGEIGIDRLLPLAYQDLRTLAKSLFGRREGDVTAQSMARVREAYLRLVRSQNLQWESRKHFFDVAAQKIRQLLVKEAQRRRRKERGEGGHRVRAEETEREARVSASGGIDPIALNEALDELEAFDPQQARILSLRYFAGLTAEETAEILGMTPRSVALDSRMAHAWLRRYLTRAKVE